MYWAVCLLWSRVSWTKWVRWAKQNESTRTSTTSAASAPSSGTTSNTCTCSSRKLCPAGTLHRSSRSSPVWAAAAAFHYTTIRSQTRAHTSSKRGGCSRCPSKTRTTHTSPGSTRLWPMQSGPLFRCFRKNTTRTPSGPHPSLSTRTTTTHTSSNIVPNESCPLY